MEPEMVKDSRPDTLAHIQKIQTLLNAVINNLIIRRNGHDASKLESPEVEWFDRYEDELRSHDYNTPGYWGVLEHLKPATDHHFAVNSHHPEHFKNGIQGMSFLDLIEMLCDWKAASQRRPNPMTMLEALEVNQKRFGYTDEVKQLFANTIRELGL
jgi:Family of unknown function (DUF5662)